MAFISESELETVLVEALAAQGFVPMEGSAAAPDGGLRASWRDVVLAPVLLDRLRRLNPGLPETALSQAAVRLTDRVYAQDLIQENRRLHKLLIEGVPVSVMIDGDERHLRVQVVDFEDEGNDWRVVRQFEVAGQSVRRPDVILFLNGLPLVVIELKGTEGADIAAAFNQLETYKAQVPDLFRFNLLSVISDGVLARYGTISAALDRFMRWRTVDGETLASGLELDVLRAGLLTRAHLLEMLRWFVVFEDDGRGAIKKVAGYHQFHAVRKAMGAIAQARTRADGKGGVIWHTQGSGKSLLMAFLAGRVMHDPGLANPTLLVLTDRNDLDNQLFATFARCKDLLGEDPVQADSVEEVKRLLDRQVGGVVFSTIQKFRPDDGEEFPQLTARDNVVVLVDEAHRTQYGFEAKLREDGELRHGLAWQLRRALPNAVYVGFTGTPVELVGANTRGVFGDYIDVYDVAQAVADGATVPIYYEACVARIELDPVAAAGLDDDFGEATEDLENDAASAAAKRWSRVEALVGADKRLDTVVADILAHFDARLQAIDGKAMIVCMSRQICVDVYDRIVASRPDWHGDTDDTGAVKVVMTGNATDPLAMQAHIRSKSRQEVIRNRFKDPADPLRLVIVRDMWLTGFDAPCMHTLYVDKPMKGHGLMQAIARVNRVFRNKPAGLVVDYIGLAAELKQALAHYSQTDQAQTGVDEAQAVAAFLDALDVVRGVLHGLHYRAALDGSPQQRLAILPVAMEFVLAKEGRLPRFRDAMAALVRGYKLASGSPQAIAHAAEVAFLSAVRSALDKLDAGGRQPSSQDADLAIRQLINQAVASTEVVDVLEACGFDRPDISVLSDAFLMEMQGMAHKNLAVEALKKLLNGEISARTRTNVVQNELFSRRLEQAIARYHNRAVDAIQVIQELIEIARDLQTEPDDRLDPAERAFYDALAENRSAVEVMSNDALRVIATELVNTIRRSNGADWWRRDDVRARMRVEVKKILRRHGYPPDLESAAVQRILQQAETLAAASTLGITQLRPSCREMRSLLAHT